MAMLFGKKPQASRQRKCRCMLRSMCPQQIGGTAMRAEVGRTEARITTRGQAEARDRPARVSGGQPSPTSDGCRAVGAPWNSARGVGLLPSLQLDRSGCSDGFRRRGPVEEEERSGVTSGEEDPGPSDEAARGAAEDDPGFPQFMEHHVVAAAQRRDRQVYFLAGTRVSVPDPCTSRFSIVSESAMRSGPMRKVTPLGPAAISPSGWEENVSRS
jgi:hypothetical protein